MFGFGSRKRREEFEAQALPYMGALFNAGLRLTRNPSDAEDLVQDTFVKAFRFFHRFEPGTNLKAWLFKILTNTFINQYRRRSRERDSLGVADTEAALDRQPAPDFWAGLPPPDASLRALFSDEVKAAIDDLPVDFRMTVLLRDIEDFTYQEIADIMDCPVGTVMSRLHRGRRMLQKRLYGHAVREGYLQAGERAAGAEIVPIDELRRRRDGKG